MGKSGAYIGGAVRKALPPKLAKHVIGYGNYVLGERELRLLAKLCQRSKVAVDVGANFGAYTYWLSKLCETVAIEPLPECATFLKAAFVDVRVIECALSDTSGDGHMVVESRSGRTIHTEAKLSTGVNSPNGQLVEVKRLDDVGIEEAGFIKIDTEGHELAVLNGALSILKVDKPVLLIECEERHRLGALESVMGLLEPLDYQTCCVTSRGLRRVSSAGEGYHMALTSNFVFVHYTDLNRVHAKGIVVD